MNKNRTEIAILVRKIRKTLKVTQQQFADQIGKNRCDIAKYETKGAIPPGDVLLDMLKLIDHNILNIML